MKNFLLFIALVSFSFASAQITTNAGTFNKPGEGETAFEFQFMPNLDGNAMFADRATVMMRQFKSDTKAVRWTASLNVADAGDDSDMTYGVALGYGIENHLAGAERLSTYWGYGGSLGYADGGDLTDDEGGVVETDGTFAIGAGVFLGADYYIMPKVYIGLEMGYGLTLGSGNDVTNWGLNGGVNGMMRVGFRL